MLRYRLPVSIAVIVLLCAALAADETVGRAWDLPGLVLLITFGIFAAGASFEVAAMMRSKGALTPPAVMAASGCIGLAAMGVTAMTSYGVPILATSLAVVFLGVLVFHCRRTQTQGAILAGAGGVLACVYLGIIPGFWLLIRQEYTAWVVAGAILVTKSSDIGAYATGRLIGRNKLIPWLSPGKTWEGLMGGLAFSAVLAVLFTLLVDPTQVFGPDVALDASQTPANASGLWPLWFAAVAGLLLGLTGQVGDLTASLLKRDAGIKDSGSAIPGFGGVLDLVDSVVLVAPVAYWLLKLGRALMS